MKCFRVNISISHCCCCCNNFWVYVQWLPKNMNEWISTKKTTKLHNNNNIYRIKYCCDRVFLFLFFVFVVIIAICVYLQQDILGTIHTIASLLSKCRSCTVCKKVLNKKNIVCEACATWRQQQTSDESVRLRLWCCSHFVCALMIISSN